jgi:tetratricopeptide (TPR) repeat protein
VSYEQPPAMPSPQDRQIRVFISSTFRDMGAERDHLVKFIFPQLRKLCESRGVTWGEVDLRWGVTDEAAAEGKVLPICLEEIKRCRPYFIGLLGERYGWVPQSIPEDLTKSEPWLEEQMKGHKSVTELEILHGVLNNPEVAGHAYFYLRDPAYLDKLPKEAKREDFTTEDAESTDKLKQVKQKIRASGFPVRENYADPKALGELVLADLTKVINDTWPEGSLPDPLDREAMDHEAFAQSRAKVYIGRDEYFQKLDAHAAGTGDQPLVILGESGSGKSALLANWALRHRAAHPGDFLLLHFIGGTPYSSDWAAMLRRTMGEFKRKFGIAQDIPDQPDALRSAFANWLHMAAAKGRIILILDALNQLEDRDGAPDLAWLPPVMPENVRLIASTLPGRALDEINKRRWPVLHVQPLDPAERQQFITGYLAQYTKALSPARAARIAEEKQSANPLYLRALLEELRLFGEHERLDERITHYLQAGTVPELYEKILARWEADYAGGTDLVGDAMTLLWAARRGLTEAELLQALGKDGEPLPRAQWSPLFLAAGDSLVSRSGLLTFFHDYLREAVRNAYLPCEESQRAAHLRLADYFEPQPNSPRQIDELPWQLKESKAWQQLFQLLSELPFFNASWRFNKLEVKSFWALLQTHDLQMADAYDAILNAPEQYDWGIVRDLSTLLTTNGHPLEAYPLITHLVNLFSQTGDSANLQEALGAQALLVLARGDQNGALTLWKQQEHICRTLGKKDGLQASLGNQGNLHYYRGDLDAAMKLYEQKERISRQIGYRDGIQAALRNQGLIHSARDNYEDAMSKYKQTEQICREIGNAEWLAISLQDQSIVFHNTDRASEGIPLAEEALNVAKSCGYSDVARSIESTLLELRQALEGFASSPPPLQRPEPTLPELRDSAANALRHGWWEGAETCFRKLLDRGEPIGELGPKIVVCILSARAVLSEHDVARLQCVIQQLEAADHRSQADDIRQQLAQRQAQNQPVKPWWRFW